MLHEKTIDDILFEISEIEKELDSFSPLLKLCKMKQPDLIETTALGSVLHSFYTGIEKVFSLISKKIDRTTLTGSAWHKDLLLSMMQQTPSRDRVISEALLNSLLEYLNFRHYFRHAYEYRLEWDKIKEMVDSIQAVWENTKAELTIFIDTLKQ